MAWRSSFLIGAILVAIPSCTKAETAPETPSAITLAVGDRPRAITTGDFDSNGKVDIAVANAESDSVSILLQNEAGGFSRTDFAAGGEPADITAADFDRNGTLDLVVANHETSSVTVLLNRGDGSFEPMKRSPFDTTARPHLHSVAVGDFNNDGFFDIASDSSDSDSIAVLFGQAGGFASGQQVPAGAFPYYRLGILEANGTTQVLVPSPRANTVSKITPSRAGSLAVIGEAPGSMMVRSANLDGKNGPDVVALSAAGIAIWFATETGFAASDKTPGFDNPTELAAGDIDGDGTDEIIVGLWESEDIHIVSGQGNSLGTINACFRPAALAIADLDGDGLSEIIAGCWNQPEIKIFDGADAASRF